MVPNRLSAFEKIKIMSSHYIFANQLPCFHLFWPEHSCCCFECRYQIFEPFGPLPMKCATLGKIRLTSAYNSQGHLSDFENVGANLYLFGKVLLSVRHLGANSMRQYDYPQNLGCNFTHYTYCYNTP